MGFNILRCGADISGTTYLVWRGRGVWLVLKSLLPFRQALGSVSSGRGQTADCTDTRTLYRAQTPVHCTQHRHPYTVHSTDTRTLYTAQTPVHCTQHRHPYTVQTPVYCTEHRHPYIVQSTDTRTLYKVQTPVHYTEYRHPYTVR